MNWNQIEDSFKDETDEKQTLFKLAADKKKGYKRKILIKMKQSPETFYHPCWNLIYPLKNLLSGAWEYSFRYATSFMFLPIVHGERIINITSDY